MKNSDLLNNAIDILLHNGISSIDLNYVREHIGDVVNDDKPDEDKKLHGVIHTGELGVEYILLYSFTKQNYWNLRALWVHPDLRRKSIATALLSDLRRLSKNSKGVVAFIPYNEQRYALSKLLLRNGYKHRRYIASISATEFNSIW